MTNSVVAGLSVTGEQSPANVVLGLDGSVLIRFAMLRAKATEWRAVSSWYPY